MNYYILGKSIEEYKKQIRKQIIACIAAAAAAVIVNVILCVLRTDTTHGAFLVINIVVDSIVLSGCFFSLSTQILPERKLYQLASRERNALRMRVCICGLSDLTQTVYGLECRELTVKEQWGEEQVKKESIKKELVREPLIRKVYVVNENEIPFVLQGEADLYVVNDIVVRAEVQS